MTKNFSQRIYLTSLTIFAMLFGAGNLMFPLRVGIEAGSQTIWGLAGFILTGVLLPLLGLLAIVAFNGDYREFFGRVGKIPGFLLVLYCMMVVGPFVVMPRIVALSYEMLQPFLPEMSVLFFATIFLSLVFLATYRPGKLLDIIGKVLSPLKVTSLFIIIIWGLVTGNAAVPSYEPVLKLFYQGAMYGYHTLDLLGAIFFGSIVVALLTSYAQPGEKTSIHNAVKVAAVSGIFAALLLAAMYAGMSFLAAFHGHGLGHLNEGQIFSAISFRILGQYGAALIGLTVFLACFTTTVSLSAVVGDYVRVELFDSKITYPMALVIVLGICAFIARHGLSAILHFSVPFILASYPVFIVITICNILYKLWGFKYIKIPVALTVIILIWRSIYAI